MLYQNQMMWVVIDPLMGAVEGTVVSLRETTIVVCWVDMEELPPVSGELEIDKGMIFRDRHELEEAHDAWCLEQQEIGEWDEQWYGCAPMYPLEGVS